MSTGLLQQSLRGHHRQPSGFILSTGLDWTASVQNSVTAQNSSFSRGACVTLTVLQGEHLEVSPATALLSQAVALGDRRTFSVYDLTQKNTFGVTHSLNLLIRWQANEGE